MNPPTWAKNATQDREDVREDLRARVEDEVSTQHGGDGAAGAQFRHPDGLRGAEEQGHRGLRHHRGEVEDDE
jgi:hypothetical protein